MSVAATVRAVLADRVSIRTHDGREWELDIRDIPTELAREGQAVSLLHDHDGWVTEVIAREPEPLPAELRARIDILQRWIDEL